MIVLLFHATINFTLTLVPVQPTSTLPLRTCIIGVGLLWAAATIRGARRRSETPHPKTSYLTSAGSLSQNYPLPRVGPNLVE